MAGIVRRIASRVLGEDAAKKIYGGMDVVGDIAIIRKPVDFNDIDVFRRLGEEIIRSVKYIRSVWLAVAPVEGEYRLRKLIHLAGEKRTETTYREHGCVFKVDISRTYISPRLSFEHIRVAKLVNEGETVINMFAGVGLFSIIIARHARPRKVISIDINPDAYRLMVENVSLNRVEGVVEPVLGDALKIIDLYRDSAERILLPLPELALEALPKAVDSLRGEGFIHVYDFVRANDKKAALDEASRKYAGALEESSHVDAFNITYGRVVRSVGPRRYQVVLDIWVRKS